MNISVVFAAKGKPDYDQCQPVLAGPTVVGKVIGEGYVKRSIPPIDSTYPSPVYVTTAPTDGRGNRGWGKLSVTLSNDLDCEEVCSSSGCEKWRIKGQFNLSATMEILSCLPVTAGNCTLAQGECRERSSIEKQQTEDHERKHYDLWRGFVDGWNERIANDMTTFDSCYDIRNYIAIILIAFDYEKEQMQSRQTSHCPDFNREAVYRMDDPCGYQVFSNFRDCQ